MASNFSISTVLLVIIFTNTVVVTAVPDREYRSMLSALRFRGYHLFANAITTTDLHYDIINGSNFTFFAPIDSALYSLDMSISAADYTTVLRLHGVPHRLSVADLRMLLYGSNSFPSLAPGYEIHVVNPMTLRLPITVEGVNIAFPGLFYGTHIAVHGLEGIINLRPVKNSKNSMNSTSIASNLTPDHDSVAVHGDEYAPAPEIPVPVVPIAPVTVPVPVPVAAPPPRSSDATVTETAASPDISLAHRIYIPGAQRYRQPETKLESFIQPETKIESIIQPETKSESVNQPRLPETISESIAQLPQPQAKSGSLTQPRRETSEFSNEQGEEQILSSTRSELHSQKLQAVSLARKSFVNAADEYTRMNDKINGCLVTDDDDDHDGELLSFANMRHGDLYARQLYVKDRTCVHE